MQHDIHIAVRGDTSAKKLIRSVIRMAGGLSL
jgi:hypothetical protein